MKISTLAIVGAMTVMTATDSFAVDPGINQPGMIGNHGVGRAAARDPGINQPGAVGNAPIASEAARMPGVEYPRGAAAAATPRVGRDPGLNQPGLRGNIRR
ncbi:MAG: hypothetical protein EHM62_00510 [Methylococcus sp.]|nr:MAG: hypothetical protein EHM62_00510 [Methylococcus sp.]